MGTYVLHEHTFSCQGHCPRHAIPGSRPGSMGQNRRVIGEASEIVGREEELTTISAFLEASHRLPARASDRGRGRNRKDDVVARGPSPWRGSTAFSRPAQSKRRHGFLLQVSTTSSKACTTGAAASSRPADPRAPDCPSLGGSVGTTAPSREPSPPRSSARYASWPVTARCSSPSTTSSGSITPQPRSSGSRPVAFATSQSGCSWHRGSQSKVKSSPCRCGGRSARIDSFLWMRAR